MKASTTTNENSPLLPARPAEDPAATAQKAITPLPKLQLGSEYSNVSAQVPMAADNPY